jgi:hypothetical protein
MPRLSTQYKVAMGIGLLPISYDGNLLTWTSHPLYPELIGQPIIGGDTSWVNPWTLVFQSCQTPDNPDYTPGCSLYTYDIRTGAINRVSTQGANFTRAGGGVWAAWLDHVGYYDSLGRTHPDYGLMGVDDDGTVLVVLNREYGYGLGYLPPTAASADDVVLITTDTLDQGNAGIRNGVVVYNANGLLTRYDIENDRFDSTNVPVLFGQNDGNWILGWHLNGLDLVAFEFGKLYAYQVVTGDRDFNGDIRVTPDGKIYVVTSYSEGEAFNHIRRYTINTSGTQYFLYSNEGERYTLEDAAALQNSSAPVIGSDVITIGRNPDGSGQGFSKVISSKEWFPNGGGNYIRGAWQYGVTAVVAQVGDNGSGNVFVKDSLGNTWDGGEVAHGIHCVAIRPDPLTTINDPVWEVTWVYAGGGGTPGEAYRRARLDTNLQLIDTITTSGFVSFGSQGMLDLDEYGEPIPTDEHRYEWYGYIKIGLATTRGDWTIGQDVSPTCRVDRLVAWNSARQQAYVVWNGYTPIQSRLALEYDLSGNSFPVVVPSNRTFKISEFLPLGQIDLETGLTPGLSLPPVEVPPLTTGAQSSTDTTPAELKKNTRVFRQPQSIPPTAKVLMAAAKSTSTATSSLSAAVAAGGPIAATLFGSGSASMEEDAPSYNPQYPFNTVLMESESGHLIEVDDSPGAERVHVYHRSGSHIEMRPDGGVKYKTVKKRQDITIGDHDVYVAGDWNIVVEGGYTLHVRKGELVIDAKDGAAFNVKGKLKISADDIEMKASKNIFLNSPKVDIGGMSPGGMPIMSIPTNIAPYPAPSIPPIFVPTLKMPLTAIGQKSMSDLTKQVKDGKITPSVAQAKMASILANTALDATGEPAFSKLTEQPGELPLSNPKLYSSAATLAATAATGAAVVSPIVYAKLRGRTFDTPEDINGESYSTHSNLSVELGDYSATAKTSPGTIVQSDTTSPLPEPPPPYAFNLPSGGFVRCVTNNNIITGVGTKFTEDLEEGLTIIIGDNKAVIQSIASDTSLVLTEPWKFGTQSGALQVYRVRPMQEFFGKFKYSDSASLGYSGLRLADMMVNFTSPVVEVPQINASMLKSGSGGVGGAGGADGDCGAPDSTIPNEFAKIEEIFRNGNFNLSTLAGCGVFVEAVVNALPDKWGHIRKSGAQTQYNGHAVDAILYKSTTPLYNGKIAQGVDIISSAVSPEAKIQWLPVCAPGTGSDWYR